MQFHGLNSTFFGDCKNAKLFWLIIDFWLHPFLFLNIILSRFASGKKPNIIFRIVQIILLFVQKFFSFTKLPLLTTCFSSFLPVLQNIWLSWLKWRLEDYPGPGNERPDPQDPVANPSKRRIRLEHHEEGRDEASPISSWRR